MQPVTQGNLIQRLHELEQRILQLDLENKRQWYDVSRPTPEVPPQWLGGPWSDVEGTGGPAVMFRVYEGRDAVTGDLESIEAVYRQAYATGFRARRTRPTIDGVGAITYAEFTPEITVRCDLLENALFTNDRFYAVRFNGGYYALSPGQGIWTEAISRESVAGPGTLDVELFRPPIPGPTDGPIVAAETDTSIAEDTQLVVAFDSRRQVFYVVAQSCPAAP